MSEAGPNSRPGVWSMAVVHQYYRREFDLAPRIVRAITPGERERHDEAAAWFAVTLAMMHHHHVTEDAMMYPLLEGVAPQSLLDRMDEQHRRVAAAVELVEERVAGWHHDDPASAELLAVAFDALLPILVEHLDSEEREVMPLVAEHLTVEEYERQGTSGNQVMDQQTLMMAFGAMVEQAPEAEAAVMLSHPPEHVRAAWHAHGEHDYRALMARIRGALTPIGPADRPAGLSLSHSS